MLIFNPYLSPLRGSWCEVSKGRVNIQLKKTLCEFYRRASLNKSKRTSQTCYFWLNHHWMHHSHPACLSHLSGQILISENQPVSHKSLVPPRGLNSCWPNKSNISYLLRSTVVTLNTTPLSHRIMKSLWEKGQFPMLSPSLPACRTEQSRAFMWAGHK